MGYYIEQIEGNYKANWDKAKETIDSSVTPMYDTFKAIIAENDFPSKAEERWTAMVEKIKTLSEELKQKIDNKYSSMMDKAQTFQGWYDSLSALAGNNGFDWAKDNGFGTSQNQTKEVAVPGPKAGNIDYSTYDTVNTYTWKAFTSVSINGDGYIDVTISTFTRKTSSFSKTDNTTPSGSKTITVTNETEYQSCLSARA